MRLLFGTLLCLILVSDAQKAEGQICYSNADCSYGFQCIQQETIKPLSGNGIVGIVVPRFSRFIRNGLGVGGLTTGSICTRVAISTAELQQHASEELQDASEIVIPLIECGNLQREVDLGSRVTISTSGMTNSLFSVHSSSDVLDIHVKEVRSNRTVC
jgi:hypothetical protein